MVEPVFSALRQQQELSRFRRRGLAGVKRELALHVLAYNLARAVALSLHCFFMGSLVGLSEFILSSTEKDRNCLVIKIVEQLFHHRAGTARSESLLLYRCVALPSSAGSVW